jgi:citrate synthase
VSDTGLLDAAQAAQRLGVKPSSLYAYVSRGLIRSHRRPGRRGSWFDPQDVEDYAALRGRHRPVAVDLAVETAITLIDPDRLRYRGYDAAWLGRQVAFESVCQLLWTGDLDYLAFTAVGSTVDAVHQAAAALGPTARLIDRLTLTVSIAASADDLRLDLSPGSVAHSGRTLVATLVEALPDRGTKVPTLVLGDRVRRKDSIAGRLWARLAPGPAGARGVGVINQLLVLLADHELATSTLAARVAASTRSNPYAAVGAALGVFDGRLHGTVSEDVVEMLEDASGPMGATGAVAKGLRRGRLVPGFGHRLYPGGDPRAVAMLEALDDYATANGRRVEERLAVVNEVRRVAGIKSAAAPNADFGLGAFVFVAGLLPDAGEAIFAIARTAGWVAHAMEEYEEEPLRFRGRAIYTGALSAKG